MVRSMSKALTDPQLSTEAMRALAESAAADGIPAKDLLEQALERELKRREKRRELIARNRRLTVFPALQARTD